MQAAEPHPVSIMLNVPELTVPALTKSEEKSVDGEFVKLVTEAPPKAAASEASSEPHPNGFRTSKDIVGKIRETNQAAKGAVHRGQREFKHLLL